MARCLLIALLIVVACPINATDAEWRSRSGMFYLVYQSELEPVVINRIHNWVLHIKDEHGAPVPGATISVRGGMPVHDHGLPTAARVTREVDAGSYLLEGLRFHMSGQWEIEITIETDATTDTVVITLEL